LSELEAGILRELISVTLWSLSLLRLVLLSTTLVLVAALAPVGLLATVAAVLGLWAIVVTEAEVTGSTWHVMDFDRSDAFRMIGEVHNLLFLIYFYEEINSIFLLFTRLKCIFEKDL
jgi:hypothetical protein